MPALYRIQLGKKLSAKPYTYKGALAIQEKYRKRGIEVKLRLYMKDCTILDVDDSGQVNWFR